MSGQLAPHRSSFRGAAAQNAQTRCVTRISAGPRGPFSPHPSRRHHTGKTVHQTLTRDYRSRRPPVSSARPRLIKTSIFRHPTIRLPCLPPRPAIPFPCHPAPRLHPFPVAATPFPCPPLARRHAFPVLPPSTTTNYPLFPHPTLNPSFFTSYINLRNPSIFPLIPADG